MKPVNSDTAEFTTFLVLGAIHARADFEAFGGQIGFVQHCIPYARKIAKRLSKIFDQSHEWPGVLSYELIEPLGAKLAQREWQISEEEIADEFAAIYLLWISDDGWPSSQGYQAADLHASTYTADGGERDERLRTTD